MCKIKTLFPLVIILILMSCHGSVKPEQLYGEWKYIKVENPNQQPPYVMPDEELKADSPLIKFTNKKDLVIIWAGKVLSHGRFRMENRMIRYKENLPGGTTREFPFLIKEITEERLVFETMQQDLTRVTAVKIK